MKSSFLSKTLLPGSTSLSQAAKHVPLRVVGDKPCSTAHEEADTYYWKWIQLPFSNRIIAILFVVLAKPHLKRHITEKKKKNTYNSWRANTRNLASGCPLSVLVVSFILEEITWDLYVEICMLKAKSWQRDFQVLCKAWELWTVPFLIPMLERRSMTWMSPHLRDPLPGMTSGIIQNWKEFRKAQRFLKDVLNVSINSRSM